MRLSGAVKLGRYDGDEVRTVECGGIDDSWRAEARVGSQMFGKAGEIIARLALQTHDIGRAVSPVGMCRVTMKIAAKDTDG
jgi:hypothetical protein